MEKAVKMIMENESGTGAPAAKDFALQIEDLVSVFEGVEKSLFHSNKSNLIWRIQNISMNSPINIALTPHLIDDKTEEIDIKKLVKSTYAGFKTFLEEKKNPEFFDDIVAKKAKRICERAKNKTIETQIDFSAYVPQSKIIISTQNNHNQIEKIPVLSTGYREQGSIEGYIKEIIRSGQDKRILKIESRLNGATIKCVGNKEAFKDIENLEFGNVWEGKRVCVFGIINYKSLGKVDEVNVSRVQLFPNSDELPTHADIIDEGFTDGVESVEYLKRLRASYGD